LQHAVLSAQAQAGTGHNGLEMCISENKGWPEVFWRFFSDFIDHRVVQTMGCAGRENTEENDNK